MDCEKAQYLIMKYVDGNIKSCEKYALDIHIGMCENCKMEFEMVNAFFNEPSNMEIISSKPVEFENVIMDKVKVNSKPCISLSKKERISCLFFSSISILAGILTVFSIFKDDIYNFLISNSRFSFLVTYFKNYENNLLNITNIFDRLFKYIMFNINFFKFSITIFLILILCSNMLIRKHKKDKLLT